MLAEILLDAVATGHPRADPCGTALAAARQHGRVSGAARPGLVLLRNCPYQPLAAREPALVCGINQAFLAGFLEGLETPAAEAVLHPRPGACCGELRAAGAA